MWKLVLVLITSTVDTKFKAEELASSLVQEDLAACVNIIGPIQSVYQWNDKIQSDEEYKLFIKSEKSLFKKILSFFDEKHPYDVPEVSLLNIEDMHPAYHSWMLNSLGDYTV